MANEIEVVVVVTSEAVVAAGVVEIRPSVRVDGDCSSVAVPIGTSEAVVKDLVTV